MRGFIALVWLAASLLWLSHDHIVRDGDEEGHVGAAELLRIHLDGGELLTFVADTHHGDLGEYPPLYPSLVAAWWWAVGHGQPGHWSVRMVNLFSLLLAAWATSETARRLHGATGTESTPALRPGARAATTTFALTLTLPLANGLSRHFMPEGLLVALVAVSVLAALHARDRRTPAAAALLGSVLGLGLLVKQTFAPLVLLPLLVAAWGLGWLWLVVALVCGAVAAPWYVAHLGDQSHYIGQSLEGGTPISAWASLLYYPATLVYPVAGPVALIAGIAGVIVALRTQGKRAHRGTRIVFAWLLGLAVLTGIPKKYPRLAAPVAPALALAAGLGAASLRRRPMWAPVAATSAGAAVLTWASLTPPSSLPWVPRVEDRCPQQWLRPANSDDLGLSVLADLARIYPHASIAIDGAPELPCAVQTTHPYPHHVEPYLRREGLERAVYYEKDPSAGIQLSFRPIEMAGPNDVVSRSLGQAVHIDLRAP